MQQKGTTNRSSTLGPRGISDGRVFAGVGLSQAQFYAGAENGTGLMACGMCLELKARMPKWDCELTQPQTTTSEWPVQTLVVMVVDVCEDDDGPPSWKEWNGSRAEGRCVTGHLDVHTFTHNPWTVHKLAVADASWRAVDCPVAELPISFVFSIGGTISSRYFVLMLWDTRVQVAKVEVRPPPPT